MPVIDGFVSRLKEKLKLFGGNQPKANLDLPNFFEGSEHVARFLNFKALEPKKRRAFNVIDIAAEALDIALNQQKDQAVGRQILTGLYFLNRSVDDPTIKLDSVVYELGACLTAAGVASPELDEELSAIGHDLTDLERSEACRRANAHRDEVVCRGDDEDVLWDAVHGMINGKSHFDAVFDAATRKFEVQALIRRHAADVESLGGGTSGRMLSDGTGVLVTPSSARVSFFDGGSVGLVDGKLSVIIKA